MHRATLEYLISPCCRAELRVVRADREDVHFAKELHTGTVGCDACGLAFPVIRGVPVLRPRISSSSAEDRLLFRNESVFNFLWRQAEKLRLDDFRREEKFLEDVRISEELFKDAAILEVGIGQGRFLPFLLDRGPRTVIGADNTDSVFGVYEAFAARTGKTRLCLVQSDPRFLPLRPESFDIVLAIRSLHHLPSPEDRLSDIFGLVRPGGRLTCSFFANSGNHSIRVLDRCAGLLKAGIKGFPIEKIFKLSWALSVTAYWVLHGIYPIAGHVPWLGKYLPLRRAFEQWRKFRFPAFRLFVIFDLLAAELSWLPTEVELQRVLKKLKGARVEACFQHEALWSAEVLKEKSH